MIRKETICALVLAGGRASRMGGKNKALVLFNGRPMIEVVVNRIRPQVGKVIISANRDWDALSGYGDYLVRDREEGFLGPLAALDAAMPLTSEWLVTLPCDAPFVPHDLVSVLIKAQEKSAALALTIEADGRSQNTFALIHHSLLPTVKPFLERGERKLGLWFDEVNVQKVPYLGDVRAFMNVNTPEELLQASAYDREVKK